MIGAAAEIGYTTVDTRKSKTKTSWVIAALVDDKVKEIVSSPDYKVAYD